MKLRCKCFISAVFRSMPTVKAKRLIIVCYARLTLTLDCVYSGVDANKSNKSGNISYTCKSCRYKCRKVNELIQYKKEAHNLHLKTALDFYIREIKGLNLEESEQSLNKCSGKLITKSPIGR